MEQVIINNTDIAVSRLSFGTGSLHHVFRASRRRDLLEAAASSGITHFDTSPYYGYGLAETSLGRFLRGRRRGFTIATKVGLYPWPWASTYAASVWLRKAAGKVLPAISLPRINWQVDRAKASLDQSLNRLGTDYVDFILLHEPDIQIIQTEEFSRWLEIELQRGRVRAWGVAGLAKHVAPWVERQDPLAQVIQTADCIVKRQASFLLDLGRSLQFTYGYLRADMDAGSTRRPEEVVRLALERNVTGSVIVSTRSVERIASLVRRSA